MKARNTFEKGLNSDISELGKENGSYSNALNIDIRLNEKDGSITLTNIKGNKLQRSLPQVYGLNSFSVNPNNTTSKIVLGGVEYNIGVVTQNTTNKDVYDSLKGNASFNSLITSGKIKLAYNESNVTITRLSSGLDFSIVGNSIIENVSKRVISSEITYPISYTTINNDIYIVSTNSTNKLGGGAGYFWKFKYNSDSFDPLETSMELIYCGNMNMTTYYNIPQTAILGRYENDLLQKIWFSDNFNSLRFINVANPQLLAEDPNTFSINTEILLYKPILNTITDVGSGGLELGIYQATYRLIKNNGVTSNYSELSNIVPIISSPMSTSYVNISGSPADSPKTITWEIQNIDISFDEIELVIIKTNSGATTSEVSATRTLVVDKQRINNNTNLIFSVDQSLINSGTPINLLEATINNYSSFTHCKTIAEKDNRLIVANIKDNNSIENLNYDTRAFRARNQNSYNSILVTNNGNFETLTTNNSLLFNSNETDDVINEYNNPSRACYYKPGTNRLGGAGTNISYEFFTVPIELDITANDQSLNSPLYISRKQVGDFTLGVKSPSNEQLYDSGLGYTNGYFADYSNPQFSGALKGYVRGEIYRFAIQFFTKTGSPLFVKWIGDIKFPEHFDVNHNAKWSTNEKIGTFPSNDFRTAVQVGNVLYGQVLGIEFKLDNLDKISNQIGGYSIVRVERDSKNKNIKCQGFMDGGVFNNFTYFWGEGDSAENRNEVVNTSYSTSTSRGKYGFWKTPYLNRNDNFPKVGDSIRIVSRQGLSSPSLYNTPNYLVRTCYNYITLPANSSANKYEIDAAILNDTSPTIGNGIKAHNVTKLPVSINPDIGNLNYFIFTKHPNTLLEPNLSIGVVFIVNIEQNLINQYGGAKYSDRSENTYISTGHFRPIRSNSNLSDERPSVFGGDIFIGLFDYQNRRGDFASPSSGVQSYTQINVVPIETDVIIPYMNGLRPNRDFTNTAMALATQLNDDSFHKVFTLENNTKTYIPKPSDFNTVNKWENRFMASEEKINGESSEKWSEFLINNYWDVDGVYGGVNSIKMFNNRLFFWQNKSFGIIQVNPKVIIGDLSNPDVNSQLQLGTGNVLQGHDYVSNNVGCIHQGSVVTSINGIYWFDANTKKLYKYGEGLLPISDLKGLHSFFSNTFKSEFPDKPTYVDPLNLITGINSIYDSKKNKMLMTFHNGAINNQQISFTLAYDDLLNITVGFYSFKPTLMISDDRNTFSFNQNGKDLYVHNEGNYGEFYGVKEKSKIEFIVVDNPTIVKAFDNLSFDTQSFTEDSSNYNNSLFLNQGINHGKDTWNRIRVTNNYQNTDFVDLIYDDNIKRPERIWKLAIPRNKVLYTNGADVDIYNDLSPTRKVFGERLRDNHIRVELEYDNLDNRLLKTNYVETSYRESKR